MMGDSEKRFQKIMEKLNQAPKPKASLSSGDGNGSLIGKNRAELGQRENFEKGLRVPARSIGSVGLVPPCRPWDRGDLMRRLATFKAMTWFGKPKVISPVNCARRGWINVEMDVLSCQACGARLLFSTPSSWTLQQGEKAAAVFSLKLDNGHKLLCPWINNACDEALALFPPTPSPALLDGYKERLSALLQLSALPLVSSSAIDYMKSPELEHFLLQSSHPSITLKNGIELIDDCRSKDLEGASEAITTDMYYQTLKIISLCGWEPHVLPYVVDCEDKSSLLVKSGGKDSTVIYTSSGPSEVEGGKGIQPSLGEHQYDQASIVLDCGFCGARVGLWAFALTQRPLEIFTLIADPNGQKESATCSADLVSGIEAPRAESSIGSTSKERSLGLNLTIAGGPPPTKQNFKPRVSFPIISRHLRAEFASNISCGNQVNTQFVSQNDDPSQQQKDIDEGLAVQLEGAGSLKRKRNGNEICVSKGNAVTAQAQLNVEFHGADSGPRIEEKSDGVSYDVIGGTENSEELMLNRVGNLQGGDASSKENALHSERDSANNVGESFCTTSNVNETIRDGAACENHSRDDKLSTLNLSEIPENNLEEARANDQKANGLENMVLTSASSEEDAKYASGDNRRPVVYGKIGEFDPIRQHRPFCPWVAPEDGESLSGWKLTLSALVHQEKSRSKKPLISASPPTSLDEVDDPVVSIRRLFMSPPTKRLKGALR